MTLETEVLRGDRVMMIDTGGWLAYLTGGDGYRTFNKFIQMAEEGTCIVSTISLTPIYSAIAGSYGEEAATEVVHNIRSKARVIDVDLKVAVKAGEIMMHDKLEYRDAVIWATAVLSEAVLLTGRTEFEPFNDVILVE